MKLHRETILDRALAILDTSWEPMCAFCSNDATHEADYPHITVGCCDACDDTTYQP